MNSPLGPLGAIVSAPVAWSSAEALALAGHGPEELAALEAEGLLRAWDRPDGRAWTLTPFGAVVAGVRLVETIEEDPRWHEGLLDVVHDRRPIHLPRYAHECRLLFPEAVPDRRRGPEFLRDAYSDEPLRLLGRKVRIDPRLRPARAR